MNNLVIYKIPDDIENITNQRPAVAYLTQAASYDIILHLEQQGISVETKETVDTMVQNQNKTVINFGKTEEIKFNEIKHEPEPPIQYEMPTIKPKPEGMPIPEAPPIQARHEPEIILQQPNKESGISLLQSETRQETSQPSQEMPLTRTSNIYRSMSNRSYTIASFSTKGGVGKTAVATNLGAVYAQSSKKTILVDLDIGTGNAADVVGIKNSQVTVENWRQYARNLPSSLQKHSSGLYILPCGSNEFEMTGEDVEDLLDLLANNFDYIVLDYGTKPFFPHTKRGLEIADKIYVISTQEQGMVQTLVSRFLAEHEDWIQSGKASLVVNRVSPLGYYKPSDIAKMANFKNWHEIPDDPQGFEAAKKAKSTPVQLNAVSAKVFYSMAGEEPVKKSDKGFFRKLFGRR